MASGSSPRVFTKASPGPSWRWSAACTGRGGLQHAYSFLHAEEPGAALPRRAELDAQLLESIREKAEQGRNVANDFFAKNKSAWSPSGSPAVTGER
jgi:hypothetical protein